jgi:hypothetical protein
LAIAVVVLIGTRGWPGVPPFSTFAQSTTLALALGAAPSTCCGGRSHNIFRHWKTCVRPTRILRVLYLQAFNRGLQVFILGNAMAGEGNPHHDAAGIRDRLEQLGYDEVADPPAPCLASMP